MNPCTSPGCHLPADPHRGTYNRCEGCHRAARDKESPLDLGGRWVLDRSTLTRVWVADPTPLSGRTARPRKVTAA